MRRYDLGMKIANGWGGSKFLNLLKDVYFSDAHLTDIPQISARVGDVATIINTNLLDTPNTNVKIVRINFPFYEATMPVDSYPYEKFSIVNVFFKIRDMLGGIDPQDKFIKFSGVPHDCTRDGLLPQLAGANDPAGVIESFLKLALGKTDAAAPNDYVYVAGSAKIGSITKVSKNSKNI